MSDTLTPPGTTTGATAKKAKKKAAAKKDPNAPKKPRKPAEDYGYLPGATINLTDKAGEQKYRGKRLEYFERLQACNGKTVEDFKNACPADDPARGWLRFFVKDGVAALSGGTKPEPKKAAAAEAEAAEA